MNQPGDTNIYDSGSAPTCAVDGAVAAPVPLDGIRGKLTCKAPLAPYTWFKTGGPADWLFEPADMEDLKAFLERLDGEIPVMALGLGSRAIHARAEQQPYFVAAVTHHHAAAAAARTASPATTDASGRTAATTRQPSRPIAGRARSVGEADSVHALALAIA